MFPRNKIHVKTLTRGCLVLQTLHLRIRVLGNNGGLVYFKGGLNYQENDQLTKSARGETNAGQCPWRYILPFSGPQLRDDVPVPAALPGMALLILNLLIGRKLLGKLTLNHFTCPLLTNKPAHMHSGSGVTAKCSSNQTFIVM